MSAGRWLAGCALVALMFVPPMIGAARARRRIVGNWQGPPAWLATALVGVTATVLTAEVLGSMGLFRAPAVAAGGLASGAALWWWGSASAGRRSVSPVEGAGGWGSRVEGGLAVLGCVGVLAQALASIGARATNGMTDPDSLHYHLTFAARFVRDASTTGLAVVSPGDAAPYHPATAELLHALGLAAFRVEVLTLVLNLAAIALALLAAAAAGWRAHRAAAAVAVTAALLSLPILGREQAGSAHNDVLALGFLLSAVAVAVHDRRSRGALVVLGLAAGLGIGTKLTVAVPIALLVVGVVTVDGDGVRAVAARAWPISVSAVIAGGYWALRNVMHAGSPFPSVLFGPPMPLLATVDQAVVHYMADTAIVRSVFIPGLHYALGPAATLVLLGATVGVGTAIARPGRITRAIALIAAVAATAYLFTPTTAGGPEGDPVLFRFNVRYLAPALALALLAATLAAPRRAVGVWAAVWVGLAQVTLASAASWAVTGTTRWTALGAATLVSVAVGGVAVLSRRIRLQPARVATAATAFVVLAVTTGGAPLARSYLANRYAHPDGPRDELVGVGRSVSGGRTGVSGQPLAYSFFGPRLGAEVSYVAERLPSGEIQAPPSCRAWRDTLTAGRYERLVVFRFPGETERPEERWTAAIPDAEVILGNDAGTAFRLPARISRRGC